jgi:hypothetical protein
LFLFKKLRNRRASEIQARARDLKVRVEIIETKNSEKSMKSKTSSLRTSTILMNL